MRVEDGDGGDGALHRSPCCSNWQKKTTFGIKNMQNVLLRRVSCFSVSVLPLSLAHGVLGVLYVFEWFLLTLPLGGVSTLSSGWLLSGGLVRVRRVLRPRSGRLFQSVKGFRFNLTRLCRWRRFF